MATRKMTPEMLTMVAERFKVLAEPARLHILSTMRKKEQTVTDIVDATGLGQANVSRHLQLLHASGFVSRRKDGLFTYYALADRLVFELCDLMCSSIETDLQVRRKTLASSQT